MMVINGVEHSIPGLVGASYLSNPKLAFTNKQDFRLRRGMSKVKGIVLHTRMGIWPQKFTSEVKDRHWDELGVKRASDDTRIASWHISVDADGSYVCHLDLERHCAYHAGQVNDITIGIELYQEADGTITEATLHSAVAIVEFLTAKFGITRQFVDNTDICITFASPNPKNGLAYLSGGKAGTGFSGVYGHRNVTKNRGRGDPGDRVFELLGAAGFQKIHVS